MTCCYCRCFDFFFFFPLMLFMLGRRSMTGTPPPNYWKTSRKLKNTFLSCRVRSARPLGQHRYWLASSPHSAGNPQTEICQKYPANLYAFLCRVFRVYSRQTLFLIPSRGLHSPSGKSLFCVCVTAYFILCFPSCFSLVFSFDFIVN